MSNEQTLRDALEAARFHLTGQGRFCTSDEALKLIDAALAAPPQEAPDRLAEECKRLALLYGSARADEAAEDEPAFMRNKQEAVQTAFVALFEAIDRLASTPVAPDPIALLKAATVPWPVVTRYSGGASREGVAGYVWVRLEDGGPEVQFARVTATPDQRAELTDDFKLPFDVKLRNGIHKVGTSFRTLVARVEMIADYAESLHTKLQSHKRALTILQELAACSRSDPMRKDPVQQGRRVTINATSALVARIDALLAQSPQAEC